MDKLGSWAGVFAAALVMSGGAAQAGAPSPAPPRVRVSPRPPQAKPSAEAPRAAALVELARSGGFAGLDEKLVVRENGTASLTRRGETSELKLTPEQMKEVRQAVKATDFGALKDSYLPPDPCCDRIEHAVTHGGRTIRMLDVPEALKPLVEVLLGVMRSASGPAAAS